MGRLDIPQYRPKHSGVEMLYSLFSGGRRPSCRAILDSRIAYLTETTRSTPGPTGPKMASPKSLARRFLRHDPITPVGKWSERAYPAWSDVFGQNRHT